MDILFPFAEYWWFYAGFTLFVLLMLVLDLGVFHKNTHAVSIREASIWTAVWITLALIFNGGFYLYAESNFPGQGGRLGLEFLTGYVVEKSLAVDNIFIFVVVFGFFGIPALYQHRVLFYGILGALVFRAIFIALGSVLMQYKFVVIFFGALLILTGIKILWSPEQKIDPDKNPFIRLLKRFVRVTPQLEGDKFFLRKSGALYATPLFVALFFLEMTDIIFAVDSVPAIFALTREPLIVFTSNIFAILGLRSMYFLLAGVVDKFRYLKYGLGFILMFVGLKMVWLNELFGGKFPIGLSLGIIGGILAASVAASLMLPVKAPGSARS